MKRQCSRCHQPATCWAVSLFEWKHMAPKWWTYTNLCDKCADPEKYHIWPMRGEDPSV